MATHGKYIVIEGPDGSGKTTQAQALVEALRARHYDSHYVHEPGATAIGVEFEKIIKNRHLKRSALTDLLLFTANRVELYKQIIEPSLKAGKIIVADRNWLSSVAYQGVAEDLGVEMVHKITEQYLPTEYLYPSFTVLLTIPEATRLKMLSRRATSNDDHFEARPMTYQEQIGKGYQEATRLIAALYQDFANTNMSHISAEGSIDEVLTRIIAELKQKHVI